MDKIGYSLVCFSHISVWSSVSSTHSKGQSSVCQFLCSPLGRQCFVNVVLFDAQQLPIKKHDNSNSNNKEAVGGKFRKRRQETSNNSMYFEAICTYDLGCENVGNNIFTFLNSRVKDMSHWETQAIYVLPFFKNKTWLPKQSLSETSYWYCLCLCLFSPYSILLFSEF